MSLLVAIIIGALVGWGGAFLLLKKANFLLTNLLMGVTGGIVGLVFYVLFLRNVQDYTPFFDVRAALSSAIGALLLVLGFNRLHAATEKKIVHKDLDTSQEDVEKAAEES